MKVMACGGVINMKLLVFKLVRSGCFAELCAELSSSAACRSIKPEETIKRVSPMVFDVADGVFEYQLTEALGPNSTHVKVS